MKRVGLLLMLTTIVFSVDARARDVTVRCGDIVAGEFTERGQQNEYFIDLKAGEVVDLTVEAKGDSLRSRVGFLDPLGIALVWQKSSYFLNSQSMKTPAVSANSRHQIVLMNYPSRYQKDESRAGSYNLHIGCLHEDGSETVAGSKQPSTGGSGGNSINNPDTPESLEPQAPQSNSEIGRYVQDVNEIAREVNDIAEGAGAVANAIWQIRSLFPKRGKGKSGKGKRGNQHLAPESQTLQQFAAPQQHFAQPQQPAAALQAIPNSAASAQTPGSAKPSQANEMLSGGYQFQTLDAQFGKLIPPEGAGTTGFLFQAEQGTKVDLLVSRSTGNLNIGFVVLDTTGTEIYQGLLMESMPKTQVPLTLPINGQYIVQIRRNEMIPVTNPVATGVNVEVTRQVP